MGKLKQDLFRCRPLLKVPRFQFFARGTHNIREEVHLLVDANTVESQQILSSITEPIEFKHDPLVAISWRR